MPIQFAVAPINWTNDDDPSLGGDISLDRCLSEMRLAGYEGCELGNKFPKEVDALHTCLAEYNLTLTTDWIGTLFTEDEKYEQSIEHFRSKVNFLKNFGVKALKVCECGHSIQQTSKPFLQTKVNFSKMQWKNLISGLHEIGKIAIKNDMYIAYHHHMGTGVESFAQLEYLLESTDPELITLLPDTGHLAVADADIMTVFDRYFDRIRYIHLKDVRNPIKKISFEQGFSFMDAVREGIFTVPGDGDIDFVPLFKFLKDKKYSGWLVVEAEQDPAKANPFDYAKKSRDFLGQYFS